MIVRIGSTPVVVNNTYQAARVLMQDWPENHGQKHAEARDACIAVLEGPGVVEDARAAFEAAAQEAGILET